MGWIFRLWFTSKNCSYSIVFLFEYLYFFLSDLELCWMGEAALCSCVSSAYAFSLQIFLNWLGRLLIKQIKKEGTLDWTLGIASICSCFGWSEILEFGNLCSILNPEDGGSFRLHNFKFVQEQIVVKAVKSSQKGNVSSMLFFIKKFVKVVVSRGRVMVVFWMLHWSIIYNYLFHCNKITFSNWESQRYFICSSDRWVTRKNNNLRWFEI